MNQLAIFDQMRRRRGIGEPAMNGSVFTDANRALGNKRDTFTDYEPEHEMLHSAPQMAQQGGDTPGWQSALSAGLNSPGINPRSITPGNAIGGAAGRIGGQLLKQMLAKKVKSSAGKFLLGFL